MTALVIAALASVLGGQPGARDHLLVSLSGEARIVRIDPETTRVIASYPAVVGPHEITVSPDRRFAYVANAGSGPGGKPGEAITAIELSSGQVTQIMTTPHRQPHDLRVSRDGTLLWVAVAPSRAVIEMNSAGGRVLRSLGAQRDGGWFVIATPDDAKLYVPLLEGRGLTAIDRSSGTSRLIISGGAFSGADVTPDGRELWALEHESRRLHIVSTATDAVIGTVPLESPDFGRVRFTPDGARLLLVQAHRLHVIDVRSRRITLSLDLPFAGKVVAVSPDGRRAAVSHPADDQVSVIDLERLAVLATMATGRTPDGVAWVR